MRRILLLAAATLAAATLAACSSQPTTPPVDSAPVAAPAPAVETPAAPAIEASAAVPAATAGDASAATPAAKPGKIPSGYRMEKRNGKELYCRNVTTLGSRFAQKTCFTREQLEEIQRRTDSAMGDMDKGMKVCTGIEGCGQN